MSLSHALPLPPLPIRSDRTSAALGERRLSGRDKTTGARNERQVGRQAGLFPQRRRPVLPAWGWPPFRHPARPPPPTTALRWGGWGAPSSAIVRYERTGRGRGHARRRRRRRLCGWLVYSVSSDRSLRQPATLPAHDCSAAKRDSERAREEECEWRPSIGTRALHGGAPSVAVCQRCCRSCAASYIITTSAEPSSLRPPAPKAPRLFL